MYRSEARILWSILILLSAVIVAEAQGVNAQWNIISSATLARIGEPARQHNPPCANGLPTPAQLVRNQIYNVMDSYIGYPVIKTVITLSPEASNWINERFGLNDGRSACAALCGVVARGTRVKVCEQDSQHGRACFAPGDTGDGPHPHSNTGPVSRAASSSGNSEVVCTDVKQWSAHIGGRVFTLEAEPR